MPTSSHLTKAADWFTARRRGERLPAHELSCTLCGERSEEAVCVRCVEVEAELMASGGSVS